MSPAACLQKGEGSVCLWEDMLARAQLQPAAKHQPLRMHGAALCCMTIAVKSPVATQCVLCITGCFTVLRCSRLVGNKLSITFCQAVQQQHQHEGQGEKALGMMKHSRSFHPTCGSGKSAAMPGGCSGTVSCTNSRGLQAAS